MFDVLIIGGGPVGSRTACRLAGPGHRVLVIEQRKPPGGKSACTGIVSKECVDLFGIEKNVILRAANSARLFSPSGKLLHLVRDDIQAYILDRKAFDLALAERAQRAGAEYIFDTAVRNIEVTPNGVKIQALHKDKEVVYEARATVLACGCSRLTEKAGLGKSSDIVVGVQATVPARGLDEVEVYFGRDVAPGFFGWLVPAAPGIARVGLLSRRTPGIYLRRMMAALNALGKIASAGADINYGVIPLKSLPRTFAERILAVGDTAGQVKPTTGGGIYFGLLCADIAAETLHDAINEGDLSAGRLAEYEQKWQKKLKSELAAGCRARKLFERASDRQIDSLFDIMSKTGIDRELLKDKDLSFDWHGKAIRKLMSYRVITRVLSNIAGLPFAGSRD